MSDARVAPVGIGYRTRLGIEGEQRVEDGGYVREMHLETGASAMPEVLQPAHPVDQRDGDPRSERQAGSRL
jgi:hypothetical protein